MRLQHHRGGGVAGLTETEMVTPSREADKLCDNALASVWRERRSRGVALRLAGEDDMPAGCPLMVAGYLKVYARKPSVRDLNSCRRTIDTAHPL